MTEETLRKIIAKAASLDLEIREKASLLDSLKAELVATARSREREIDATKGGGRCWTAQGDDGSRVRVTFPAPKVAFETIVAAKR